MKETVTYDLGYAKVRIHPGKLSDGERKELWKRETTKYLKAVMRQRAKQQRRDNNEKT